MGSSRQESWSGLPNPPPGDGPDPGIEPTSPASEADFLPPEPPRKPFLCLSCPLKWMKLSHLIKSLNFQCWQYGNTSNKTIEINGKHPEEPKATWNRFLLGAPPVSQIVKNLRSVQETWVWSLGQEDPLEKGTAAHSSIFAWRTPWTEEPGWLQSTGSQRVGHEL